jgi:hypothetical protein
MKQSHAQTTAAALIKIGFPSGTQPLAEIVFLNSARRPAAPRIFEHEFVCSSTSLTFASIPTDEGIKWRRFSLNIQSQEGIYCLSSLTPEFYV